MTNDTAVECGNCGWTGTESTCVHDIKDLWERMAPGDIFPSGECPECGALVIPSDNVVARYERRLSAAVAAIRTAFDFVAKHSPGNPYLTEPGKTLATFIAAEGLTERQRAALRGELSPDDFEAEGMGLFTAGMVTLDPLEEGAKAFGLTETGRAMATYLRQHGTRYIFNYPKEFELLPEYSAHRGQVVTVIRPLRPDEYDFEGDLMFLVRAEDGWEGQAWASELAPIS